MAGGLIQLLATGAQDHILVGNPQISFFKIVYRRHTNFSMETIKLDPVGQEISASSNTIINCDIKRNAELLSSVYFTFELPAIYSGSDSTNYVPYEFKWIENIGTNIIDSTRLLIGGTEIDRHTSQFLNIYSELRLNETAKKAHNELIGHVPEMYNPTINTVNNSHFIPVLDSDTGGLGTSITHISNHNKYNVYYDTDETIGTFTISGVELTLTGTNTFQPVSNLYIGDYIRIGVEEQGTCGTVANTTIILSADTVGSADDFYIGYNILVNNQLRTITDYVTSNKTATISVAWTTNPPSGSFYELIPIRREIIDYSSSYVAEVAPWSATAPTVLTNGGNCVIERGNGSGMTVRLTKHATNNEINTIEIIDQGQNYKDSDKLYIDMDGAGAVQNTNDPTFYLLKSNYPHIRSTNTSVSRQYDEHTNELHKNVVQNADVTKANVIPSIPKRKIKVPLRFFFSSDNGLALPLISLQYHEVNIEITLKKISDLFTIVERLSDSTSLSNETISSFHRRKTTNTLITEFITPSEFKLNYGFEANYIFLDTEERRRFAENNQEYLIQEVQMVKLSDVDNTATHDIQLYHPVKEIIIVPQRTDMSTTNNWNNYTNWPMEHIAPYSHQYLNNERHYLNKTNTNKVGYNKHYNPSKTTDTTRNFEMQYFRKNIIDKIELRFNGDVRQRQNDSMFYNKIQPYQHHKTAPKDGINVYSFSLNPNEFQPSGSCNFSRIQNFQIKLDLGIESAVFAIPEVLGVKDYKYDIQVYAINYNILKIASGMGAKQFAN
jgi:hypothetical protein